MSQPAPSGLAHSIQERLKNEARRAGRPYVELLELFAVLGGEACVASHPILSADDVWDRTSGTERNDNPGVVPRSRFRVP
jgi:hypothetical protein